MGSKCNHISILKGSYQDLNRIIMGWNLNYGGIICKRSFPQININILSYHIRTCKNSRQEVAVLHHRFSKNLLVPYPDSSKKSLSRMLYFRSRTNHKYWAVPKLVLHYAVFLAICLAMLKTRIPLHVEADILHSAVLGCKLQWLKKNRCSHCLSWTELSFVQSL